MACDNTFVHQRSECHAYFFTSANLLANSCDSDALSSQGVWFLARGKTRLRTCSDWCVHWEGFHELGNGHSSRRLAWSCRIRPDGVPVRAGAEEGQARKRCCRSREHHGLVRIACGRTSRGVGGFTRERSSFRMCGGGLVAARVGSRGMEGMEGRKRARQLGRKEEW